MHSDTPRDARTDHGSTPPRTTDTEPTAPTVVNLADARDARGRRARWSPFRRSAAPDEQRRPDEGASARAARWRTAFILERDFAVTVRAADLARAEALALAAGRVVPALLVGDGPHCHIRASGRDSSLPSLMVEGPGTDLQSIDTLLRCLESIAGTALRAKVVLDEGGHQRMRTWVGGWIDPEDPAPGRQAPPHLSPAAA